MTNAAIIVAAGRGIRTGAGLPKQYRILAGRPLVAWSLEPFLAHPGVTHVVPVIHRDDDAWFQQAASALRDECRARLLSPVFGGASRQASVLQGLEALQTVAPGVVL